MVSGKRDRIYFSDEDSDDIDLQTVTRRRQSTNSNNSNQPTIRASTSAGPSSSSSGRINNNNDKNDNQVDQDEDPDWVRDFSIKQSEDENHKKAVASLYAIDNDENDSIIDLLSDKELEEEGEVDDDGEKQPDKSKKKESAAEDNDDKNKNKKISSGSNVMKSSLPLIVNNKLEESLVLLQGCGNGEELDLSGDVGTVGRVKVSDDGNVYIDMKGSVFKAEGYVCNTMAVMTVGEDDARINGVLDEAVLLKYERNLFECDQVVKGNVDDVVGHDDEVDGDDDDDDDENGIIDALKTGGGEGKGKGKGKGKTSGDGAKGSGGGRGRGRGRGSRSGGTPSGSARKTISKSSRAASKSKK